MRQWMKTIYDEALSGMLANEGGPFGAAIVQNGKLIASAHNEVLKTNDPTAHAEINVIRKASRTLGRFDLSDCVLYTTCKPCPMCLGAVFWARIGTIYYSATEEDAARGGFDDQHFYEMICGHNSDVTFIQVDDKNSRTLFDKWLAKEDRQLY